MRIRNLFFAFSLILLFQSQFFAKDSAAIFQISTLAALQEGVYDGAISIGELKKKGDLGIGTFEGLDGEMIVLEGMCYQVKSDGKVYQPSDQTLTPFSDVVLFKTDKKYSVQAENFKELQMIIESNLPSRNIPYAFKITGNFDTVKTRSVAKQAKPYPRLADAVKQQVVFDMSNQSGIILGFWMPEYAKGINMPGYHFHFINQSKSAGGHLLDAGKMKAQVEVCIIYDLTLKLPANNSFYRSDLSSDKQKELEKIEK
jgi:acetolactate decarboxylase